MCAWRQLTLAARVRLAHDATMNRKSKAEPSSNPHTADVTRRQLLSATAVGMAALQPARAYAKAGGSKRRPVKPLKTWLTYAINAEMFWKDLPFVERLHRIADAGIQHFEFWSFDKDLVAVADVCAERGLKPVQFVGVWNLSPGKGGKPLGSLPKAIDAAKKLGVKMMTVVAGNELKDVPRQKQTDDVIAALSEAAKIVEPEGITLILEPLNVLRDHKGAFVVTSEHAAQIVRAVNSPNVKILFDVYHQQISEGNLSGNIDAYKDLIGYFQIADHPGRHEPYTGEVNYAHVLGEIHRSGVSGPIGLELHPLGDPKAALAAVIKVDAEARKLAAARRA